MSGDRADHVPWFTFGILLLFLALEPEATATCNEEVLKKEFRDMIITDITELENIIEQYAPACNQSDITVFCSQDEVIEAIYNMSCQLERISNICNITENLKERMYNVADLTFRRLKTHCPVDQRDTKRRCQGTGGRKRLCPKCRIKEAVTKFKICWFQFVKQQPP